MSHAPRSRRLSRAMFRSCPSNQGARLMDDLHDMPGHLIRRAQQITTALFAEECGNFDLTSVHYAALVAIRANPEVDATRCRR